MRRLRLLLPAFLLCACGETTAPASVAIASVYPPDGATNVVAAPVLQVRYTAPMGAFQGGGFSLIGGTRTVTGAAVLADARTVVYELDDVLEPATTYTATYLSHRWSFTTRAYQPALGGDAYLRAHVSALAHDSMGGRLAGSTDELRAAEYVRARFQEYGLTNVTLSQFPFAKGVSQNVVGMLPGLGPIANQWVVVGAHYDHIGRGAGGVVFNGADDNASGTALMLELARVLAAHVRDNGFGGSDRRSVLFLAFGAEEAGLLGSNFFCGHPPFAMSALSGMVNLDMVGRLRSGAITVHGLESSPQWGTLVERHRGELVPSAGGQIGTDYRCFLTLGVPAVALFTGTHSDYHAATDDAERINYDGMLEVGELALGLATNLMLRPQLIER